MVSDGGAAARRPYASTMWDDGDEAWHRSVIVVDARALKRSWRVVVGLVAQAPRRDALILHGAVPARLLYRDLVAAVIVRWTSRRCRLLITDATWSVGSATLERLVPPLRRLVPWVARTAVRLLDSERTHYAVLSTDEQRSFAGTWGVDPARVHFTPFFHTLHDPADQEPSGDGGYLFSGGNSLRDYELLEAAAEGLSAPVRVAAAWRPARPHPGLIATTVDHRGFVELLRGCTACVVPLQPAERSAGQQTYLNAMLLGKPVIVTDAPGVRDHVEHGVTGVVVPPDPAALRRAMEHVLDPAHAAHYAAMGAAARADVLARFTPALYWRSLLDLAAAITAPAR
jgi:glycosyltransferase involved in cell wall biosynthesis